MQLFDPTFYSNEQQNEHTVIVKKHRRFGVQHAIWIAFCIGLIVIVFVGVLGVY